MFREFGWQMLAHAIASGAVYLFGLGPFINYYGATFILFEVSTPFLNVHWFVDKVCSRACVCVCVCMFVGEALTYLPFSTCVHSAA